jgi:HlyD family secretion protein
MSGDDETTSTEPREGEAPRVAPLMPPRRVFVVALLALGLLVGWGGVSHWRRYSEASATQEQIDHFVPTVRVGEARLETGPVKLVLVAQTLPFDSTAIQARATGYIGERFVDIGSRIKKGDLMVRISAPDLDAQLAQAQAQLQQFQAAEQQAAAQIHQAQANMHLADVTNKRTAALAKDGWQTQQQADTTGATLNADQAALTASEAAEKVAEANVAAQRATVQRLQELTGYEKVVAPFDGVVTSRSIDVGDLVTADTNGGTPMFTIQNDNVLRVSVQVPQSGAVGIKDGLEAQVEVPEMPGQVFHGKVARSSVSLNNASRSLTAEVDIQNDDHRLRAGLFVTVSFDIPRERPGSIVPDEALLFNAQGEQVATLGPDNKVTLRKVTIARDFGTEAEIAQGLDGGERIVLTPPVDLTDGATVQIAQPPPSPPAPQPAARTAERK